MICVSPTPKVSICIPTFNYAEYIGEALDSILLQLFPDFEVIIVDDGSTDDTVSVVKSHPALQDNRFRLVVNSVNMGMVVNWNYCLTLSKGDYIKYLFADDYLVSADALGLMVAALDDNPGVTLVSSSRQCVTANSCISKTLSPYSVDNITKGYIVIQNCISRMKNLVGEPSAVMFRRRDAERGFNTKYRQLVDLEMWFYLLEKGDFVFFVRPLCSFRIHDKQQTAVNRGIPETLHETGWLHDSYLSKPYITLSPFSKKYLRMDYRYQIWKGQRKRGLYADYPLYDSFTSRLVFYLQLFCYKLVKPLVKFLLK